MARREKPGGLNVDDESPLRALMLRRTERSSRPAPADIRASAVEILLHFLGGVSVVLGVVGLAAFEREPSPTLHLLSILFVVKGIVLLITGGLLQFVRRQKNARALQAWMEEELRSIQEHAADANTPPGA